MKSHLFYSSLHRYVIGWAKALATPPSAAVMSALSVYLNAEEANGNLALYDRFRVAFTANEVDITFDVITATSQGSKQGTITFTPNVAWRGDGTTGYYKTGVVLNTLTNFTQNSACIIVTKL